MLCGALWPQPAAQQALQRVSVSLLHVLAADLGESFGAAASVLPAGGALNKGSVALGLRSARSVFPTDENTNFNFDSTRKTAGNWEPLPALGSAAPRHDTSAPREAEKTEATFTFFGLCPSGMNWP